MGYLIQCKEAWSSRTSPIISTMGNMHFHLKEKSFSRKDLVEQLREGHIAIFPLSDFPNIKGLCLSPLAAMMQMRYKNWLIYRFSWSSLKEQVQQTIKTEAMRFVKALHHIMDCIIEADPELGPTYLSRVNLDDEYMCIWVLRAYIPYMILYTL